MKTDFEIQRDVMDELNYEPSLKPNEILLPDFNKRFNKRLNGKLN
ncbi:MAG: hypothetical protein Q7W45_05775 [Bacteroidota bacterium]|nr:hypothetical protein [Bacteroidota bacterium]MDP3144955.1 hypothetical protein [Bacteroidota bacterium]